MFICDREVSARIKRKVYKMVVTPVPMCDLERVKLTKKDCGWTWMNWKGLDLHWEWPKQTQLEISASEGQLGLSNLEMNLERQGWDELDICTGGNNRWTRGKRLNMNLAGKGEEKGKRNEKVPECRKGGFAGSWCETEETKWERHL